MKLPLDEQNEVIQLVGCGIPNADIGEAYGVCEGTVRRLHSFATGRTFNKDGEIRQLYYGNKKTLLNAGVAILYALKKCSVLGT